jgi:Sulfatase-modifying factor enzyme 1
LNKTCFYLTAAFFALNSGISSASNVTVPNSFTSGTPALAGEVNANFDAVAAGVNDNDSRVTTNTGDIATNASAIGTNAADIADNVTDIGTNTANIGVNAAAIATNTSDIASIQNSVNCSADMVAVGPLCVDIYEASVWSTSTGGTQYGIATDDYPCNDDGSDCGAGAANPVYALSLAGETPSSTITWYQAAQACANVGKRLPTTAEWQLAASGTPGGLNNTLLAGCNTNTLAVSLAGEAANCLSSAGAADMIGNLWEWVAELDAPSNPGGSNFTSTDASIGRALGTDYNSAASGADTTTKSLLTMGFGGSFSVGPNSQNNKIGFRCVR